ncbi:MULTISPECIES: metallophosphoesterase [unclassified Arcicella]|uniref:metallophosphoesterase n=1 Tax=unclassified Arcicella TaxID=2644986 RepID=UPI00285D94D0|nr:MULTISPECIES: metallophosphoesterase [unclassified Arcicella]MDR6563644.1 putative MPP superfamily phosphohydrolase [Arcicella sp. BE51]MDR6814218.1 putative MPP superfamily phosphohydrolase [Arcicella sp. BE140]MDR6825543.1 putative MPP superfamily phosphohydrolase [Arcicella sp. BE139]
MNKLIIIPILSMILLLIDWYVWQAVKVSVQNTSANTQNIVKYVFWAFTAISMLGLWLYNFTPPEWLGKNLRTIIMVGVFISYISKIFVVLFLLIDDIIRLFRLVISKFTGSSEATPTTTTTDTPSVLNTPITRSEFLMKTAVIAGTVPALALTWGIISGAHDYRIRRVKLALKNLPKEFDGMTIAQISDIHSGSFFNRVAVKGGVEMLMKEKPDVVFFTGDLVNNLASEVQEYIDIFNKIKAPLGVYSTLGNHDYADYVNWGQDFKAKQKNLQDLMHAHKVLGYDLLMDENRFIEQGGEKLAIIGVQNISGQNRFHTYGNLSKAVKGTEEAPVKLLLSHDPTHWDKEVNTKYKDIDVMFSGHTHGTQFGITVAGQTWTPAQYVYKQWGGLYQEGDQQLYVNRGYGYIGYPGRVGMPPEITVFELKRA